MNLAYSRCGSKSGNSVAANIGSSVITILQNMPHSQLSMPPERHMDKEIYTVTTYNIPDKSHFLSVAKRFSIALPRWLNTIKSARPNNSAMGFVRISGDTLMFLSFKLAIRPTRIMKKPTASCTNTYYSRVVKYSDQRYQRFHLP